MANALAILRPRVGEVAFLHLYRFHQFLPSSSPSLSPSSCPAKQGTTESRYCFSPLPPAVVSGARRGRTTMSPVNPFVPQRDQMCAGRSEAYAEELLSRHLRKVVSSDVCLDPSLYSTFASSPLCFVQELMSGVSCFPVLSFPIVSGVCSGS